MAGEERRCGIPRRNSGPKLKRVKNRPNWYIIWYENGAEHRKSTGTEDSRAAEEALAELIYVRKKALRSSKAVTPEEFGILDALTYYAEEQAPNCADPARIGYAMKHLIEFWQGQTVGQITKLQCAKYCLWRETNGKVSVGTTRRELAVLRAAVRLALAENRISSAPVVKLPPNPEGRDRWLTRSEFAKLLNAARTGRRDVRKYLTLFLLIGVYTGARSGAILELKWGQVDLKHGRIDFLGDRSQTSKRRLRSQPIARRLATFLSIASKGKHADDYVINLHGNQIKDLGGGWSGDNAQSGNGAFGNACRRAGLANVLPHTLRHTSGTWMAQRGVPMHQIAGWLGHSTARTTELYAHHHPEFMKAALGAFD